MAKAVAIVFLMVVGMIVARPARADLIEVLDQDEWDQEFGTAEYNFEIDAFWQGIDFAKPDAPKPPPVECIRVCEAIENAAQFACDFLGTAGRRGGCRAGVGVAGAVCRWVCTQ